MLYQKILLLCYILVVTGVFFENVYRILTDMFSYINILFSILCPLVLSGTFYLFSVTLNVNSIEYILGFFISFIASGVGLSALYCGHFWPIVPAPR
jgi:hypothetical protein